jgi:4-hydroxy-3-methylbut-2-enyl diphosphate reductase
VVTQTTLSVDDAAGIMAPSRRAFHRCASPSSRTSATPQNRQDAVKVLAPQVDVVIVVGSPTSSNSNRLRELAARLGTPAYMVDNADELRKSGLPMRPAWA